MAKSNAELAKEMLSEMGYVQEGRFNFGEADGHLLRALFLVAIGQKDLGPNADISPLIKELQDDDMRAEVVPTKPPWKK